ncbi:unnamed protein product [Effrenium voratum]|nr:unnamed protein product [Effrenium voratum]
MLSNYLEPYTCRSRTLQPVTSRVSLMGSKNSKSFENVLDIPRFFASAHAFAMPPRKRPSAAMPSSAKRPAAKLLAAKRPAAKGAAKFPITWTDWPGEGDGYLEGGVQARYVDQEAESLDRTKLEETLKELESAVDGAEWREDENGLTAPGGFEMRCSIGVEDQEDYVIAIQTPEHSLVVGNLGCHPFVELEWMWFGNSDGSTSIPVPDQDISKDAKQLCKRAIEDVNTFIFHQEH